MPLKVLILPKEDAVDVARSATTRIRAPTEALVLHLFCDASYKDGSHVRRMKPAAALAVVANIWLPLATKNHRTSKACFIPCHSPDDNSYTAEALALVEGAYVALDQIAMIEAESAIGPADSVEIIFWSDCQTVLREIGSRGFRTPKRLRHIIDMIELKTLDIQRSRKNVSVQFLWCPQECVEPHETADQLSKSVRMTGGSGTRSKALHMLHSLPHRVILSALEHRHTDASQGEADHSTDVFIPTTTDVNDQFCSAVRQLVAAKLEEMAKELRAEDQTQDKVQDSEGRGDNSKVQGHKREDHTVKSEGQDRDQDGSLNEEEDEFCDAQEIGDCEDEDQFYDALAPGDGDDGDVDVNGELAMPGGGVGRQSRMRALWNWMRRRSRL